MILAFGLFFNGANGQIIISQVYEGASNNKWVEITNVGPTDINLSSPLQYKLAQWNAGGSGGNISLSGNPTTSMNLSGVLTPGAVYLIKNNSSSNTTPHNPMPTANDSNTTVAGFNGNDGLAIITGTNTIIDAFGTGINNTDISYHRNASVLSPNSTFVVGEWTTRTLAQVASSDNSTTEYIGVHLFDASSTSTTWEAGNWSNGTPTSTLDAIIAGDYSTASTAQGAFTAKSLRINSGIFTIASGTTVTVNGIVNNTQTDANFVIKSGGNLIQTTTVANTGAITVERNSAPIVRLDHTLWSSPVLAQNLYAFSPNTLTNRFYVYNTPTDTYVTTGISATSTFVPGKGFGVRAPNNHPTTATQWLGTFKGIPNNGEVTFAASTAGTGFNLVGNPYPSAISGTAFINANPSLNGTLYFYAHSLSMNAQGVFPQGTNYATWNLTGSTVATTTATNSGVVPNGTIQVGQGFIVKATSAGDVTFTNAMRTADTNNQFFRTANQFTANSEVEKHRLWLDLTNPEGTAFNQILIGYVTGATEGFDRGYDGLAFGNTGSYISTKIEDSEYAIQAKSLPFQASDVVPVSFKAETAGSYTISLSNMDGLFSGDQTVFLKDNATNTLNDLKSGSYTFTTTEGTFNNRFEVVYQTTLSTPQSEFAANSVVAFKRANVLNVETKNFEMASVKAYDVQGRLVYSKSGINASAVQLSDLQVQNGVLLLQVTSTEGTSATIKVIY